MIKTVNPKCRNNVTLWSDFCVGDDKAYVHFFREYAPGLFSYGMKFTSDRELVKDSIQDVFVNLYARRSRLSNIENVKLYLYMSLKNTLFNAFNKDKLFYHIDTVEPVFQVEYSIEDNLIADETKHELSANLINALETLSPRQKEVLYYRYSENMRINDIAKIMAMNSQSVQNLLQRAIKKAKKAFMEVEKTEMKTEFLKCHL